MRKPGSAQSAEPTAYLHSTGPSGSLAALASISLVRLEVEMDMHPFRKSPKHPAYLLPFTMMLPHDGWNGSGGGSPDMDNNAHH